MQTVYLAGGCFWCTEAIFQRVKGVVEVVSGYCNGSLQNPTYEDVCSGKSEHAEVVEINFDESVVSFNKLLEVFFATHDATTLNRQGNDSGTQYRSAIFYTNAEQHQQALDFVSGLPSNIVTEITKLCKFYKAEHYHQNYFNNNKYQPYCRLLIASKIKKYFK